MIKKGYRIIIAKAWVGFSICSCCFLSTTISAAELSDSTSNTAIMSTFSKIVQKAKRMLLAQESRPNPSQTTPSATQLPNQSQPANSAQAVPAHNQSAPVNAAPSAQAPITPDVDSLLAQYYDLKATNPEQAFIFIQKIITLYPKNAEAQAEYGYLLYDKKQFNQALHQFQIAEQLNPGNYDIKMQIAYTLVDLQQKQNAYDKFKEIATSATDPKVVKKAKEGMLSVQGLQPNLGETQSATGQAAVTPAADSLLAQYYDLKATNPNQALILIQKIVTLYPNNKEAQAEYGYLLYSKKQYKEALHQFKIAEKLDPTNDDIKLQIAYTLDGLGQKQDAYNQFKQIAASASNPKVVQEAKNGILSTMSTTTTKTATTASSTSTTTSAATAQQGVDALLDKYYALKKTNPAQALVLIRKIVDRYPTNTEAQLEYAYLLSDQKNYKEALQRFLIVQRLKPNDFEVKLSIAYTLNDLQCNREAYFKFWEIAHTAPNEKIAQEAREGMISLSGYQTRILPRHVFADLYLSPYHMSRFHDTIYYSQARLGLQFGEFNQIQIYVTNYLNKDTASRGGIAPAIYNDNSLIYDVGIRYTPYEDSPFYLYLEGGKAHNLILDNGLTNRWTNDFRGGIDLYKEWGMQPEYVGTFRFPFKQVGNIYGDLSYYSRYDRDWILQLRVREGLRALEYHYSAIDIFLQLEGFADTQQEFFNNIVDYGPGISFIPDVRWGVAFRAIALRNTYIAVNSPTPNPYSRNFNNLLLELEAYFGF